MGVRAAPGTRHLKLEDTWQFCDKCFGARREVCFTSGRP